MSVDIHVDKKTDHVYFGSIMEKSEIEVGTLQMQVLWALSRKGMHGYELMKALSAIKGTKITQGTLYPVLHRLVELKMVERHTESTGQRQKYVYNLTSEGLRTMNTACLEFVKTFYGIFHDFACERCSLYKQNPKGSAVRNER